MKMNRVTRSEFNKLMTIPEAKQIYEAKLVQLKLLFMNKIRIEERQEPQPQESTNVEPVYPASNIIPLPVHVNSRRTEAKKREKISKSLPQAIKIVDASGYKDENEEEQLKIFKHYFENHPALRKAVLDDFFLKILPYSNINLS